MPVRLENPLGYDIPDNAKFYLHRDGHVYCKVNQKFVWVLFNEVTNHDANLYAVPVFTLDEIKEGIFSDNMLIDTNETMQDVNICAVEPDLSPAYASGRQLKTLPEWVTAHQKKVSVDTLPKRITTDGLGESKRAGGFDMQVENFIESHTKNIRETLQRLKGEGDASVDQDPA